MSNNFFNLDSDDEDQEEKEEEEKEKAIRKWDWDREENAHLYYGHSSEAKLVDSQFKKQKIEHEPSWRSDQSNDLNNSNWNAEKLVGPQLKNTKIEPGTSNHQFKTFEDESKRPTIERVQWDNKNSSSSRLLYNLKGHSQTVNRINWKKGHETILLSSSMDRKIFIWDLANPKSDRSVKSYEGIHSKSIRNAIWSLNQTEIVSVGFDNLCALTDIETGRVKNRLETSDLLSAVCVHPSNEYLIQIGSRNSLLSWDTREKMTRKVYKAPIGLVQDIIFLNDNEFVSSGDVANKESDLYSIVVWDMTSGARLSDQIIHDKYVCTSLARHPTKPVFYAQSHGNCALEFSARAPYKLNNHRRFETKRTKGGAVLVEQRTQGYYIGCQVNPSGSLLASGSLDGRAFVYSVETCELVRRVDAFVDLKPLGPCMDVKLSRMLTSEHPQYRQPGGRCLLAAASSTGLIRVFEF